MTVNSSQSPNHRGAGPTRWWWAAQLLLTALAAFFVFFGVSLLAAAYRLGDPFSFILTFFAASLIILISLVMTLGFVLRMLRARRLPHASSDHERDA